MVIFRLGESWRIVYTYHGRQALCERELLNYKTINTRCGSLTADARAPPSEVFTSAGNELSLRVAGLDTGPLAIAVYKLKITEQYR
ncbi:hypothetical protein PoB_006190100 [Plakobranchus ocellatus]|uniref:CUB domain-containing protein n=1 Tax=Plakobranchus ocellatus TaxID=259542 RepID=A0AAV4CTZ6_9GAST|nr:hypothetical protein PoB_006190100 [Plakobranchus ocellatus]